MNNAGVTVDAGKVLSMFAALSDRNQSKVYRSALKKASAILIKDTRARIKSELDVIASYKNEKSGKSLLQGVRSRSVGPKFSKIHIMAEYRLKWFEKGTADRQTRKGYNRGKMSNKYYFFRDARQSKEREIFDSIESLISQSIQNISAKK